MDSVTINNLVDHNHTTDQEANTLELNSQPGLSTTVHSQRDRAAFKSKVDSLIGNSIQATLNLSDIINQLPEESFIKTILYPLPVPKATSKCVYSKLHSTILTGTPMIEIL